MRIFTLLFLLAIPFLNFAQGHEIAIGISGFDNSAILKNPSISYHHFLNKNIAVGLRAAYHLDSNLRDGDQSNWQIDLLQRYDAKTKGRLSMSLEGGLSFSRQSQAAENYYDELIFIDSYYEPYYQRQTYWGLVTGLGVHYEIIKNNKIGINFRYNYWRKNQQADPYSSRSNGIIKRPLVYFTCAYSF